MARLKAPSGFRDLLPDAFRKRAELISRIRSVYESFGFEGMETPCLEQIEILEGKGGGENEKLMFRILKRGEALKEQLTQSAQSGAGSGLQLADLGLRFDLTVPLARYFATNSAALPPVFKRYQIGPVWRAERPQHGRFREFYQCDIDVLGSTSMLVEAEVILATSTALARLGFQGLHIRFNSRPLLTDLLAAARIPPALTGSTIVVLDKLEKIGVEAVGAELKSIGLASSSSDDLLDFYKSTHGMNNEILIETCNKKLSASENARIQLEQIREILVLTPELPSGKLVFDPFLARGLDYYTGPIFEIAAAGVPFSLAGGGRFDDLIERLSGQRVPACGFSIGFERVYTVMDERGMFELKSGAADVALLVPDEALATSALRVAQQLREYGLRVDLFPGVGKPKVQFECAEKKGIAYAVLLDAKSLAEQKVTLRNLVLRSNREVAIAELSTLLK